MLLDPRAATSPRSLPRSSPGSAATRVQARAARGQLEIITEPSRPRRAAAAGDARSELARRPPGRWSSPPRDASVRARRGRAQPGGRYDAHRAEFGRYARRQLVFALQIHIAPARLQRRSLSTTRCAPTCRRSPRWRPTPRSTRGGTPGSPRSGPKIAELLPRQGVPPPLASWDGTPPRSHGASAPGRCRSPAPGGGSCGRSRASARSSCASPTPKPRSTRRRRGGVRPVPGGLALAEDRGRRAARAHPGWRIAENRWWAARDGVEGELADLDTGDRQPARERFRGWWIARPYAERLGCADGARVGARADRRQRRNPPAPDRARRHPSRPRRLAVRAVPRPGRPGAPLTFINHLGKMAATTRTRRPRRTRDGDHERQRRAGDRRRAERPRRPAGRRHRQGDGAARQGWSRRRPRTAS